jgi:DNA-binding transcriptional LysR family regulator
VREIAAANAAIATLGKSLHGHVRVSVPIALGHLYLGPLLLEFAREHPKITLEVVFNNRVFDLMAAEVDVALRITSDPPPQYVARELACIGLMLCASPEYVRAKGMPRAPEDLAHHVFISRTALNDIRITLTLRRDGKQWEVGVPPHIQSENSLFMKDAALAGIGFAVLPYYAVRDEIAQKKLLVLLPDYTVDMQSDKLFMITAPNRYPTVATRALVEFLKARVQAQMLLPSP